MLTKDSFPLTYLFLYYQTLENTENYLYTRFSIETNGALVKVTFCSLNSHYVIIQNVIIQKKMFNGRNFYILEDDTKTVGFVWSSPPTHTE